ncbi:ABC transporter permease subunit [Micromonospora sp. MP36]|nr:ABC transporter permease subunit [Micromonospora sp. MP36]
MSTPTVRARRSTIRRPTWMPDAVVWLALPAVIVLLALFVLPLSRLVVDSLVTDSGMSLSRYTDLLHDGLFIPVMERTIKIALVVTVVAALIGYPLAYAATRLPRYLAAAVLASVSLPFFTSTLVRSYAWRALMADNGVVNNWLTKLGIFSEPHQLVFNDIGIVVGMSQVLLPMMTLPLYAAMSGIDRKLTDAARSMGASPFSAWRTVFLPQSVNGLMAGASLVFISSLGFYTTPALLGGPAVPMIAQRIDVQINTQNQYGPTAAQATILLIGVVILMVLLRRPLGLTSPQTLAGGTSRAVSGRVSNAVAAMTDLIANRLAGGLLGRAGRLVGEGISYVRHVLLAVVTVVGIVILVGPQLVVLMLAFNSSNFLVFPPTGYSTRWFEEYFTDEFWLSSTYLSLTVAIAAAALATVLGVLCAFAVARTRLRKAGVLFYLLSMAPLVMPPIIYAVALFFLFARGGLLGTPTALVLAYTILGLPYVMITSQAVIRNIDPLYEHAAASLGANAARRARDILLPLILPAAISSLLFAFVMAFDDLVLGVFLGSAQTVTLQVRMYQNIQFEVSPKVAAVGVLMTFAMLFVGFLVMVTSRIRGARGKRS